MSNIATNNKSRWFRINLWLHRWASLVVTIPFLILCLSGTILIFHEEIDEAMGLLPPAPGLANEEQPFSVAIDNVLSAYPNERPIFVGIDAEDHPGLLLISTVPNGDSDFDNMTRRFATLATGELTIEKGIVSESLTGFLFELHAEWFLGTAGALVGALIALLVLISLFSAMAIYAPYVRQVVFGMFRRKRSTRVFQLDVHNFIGAVVLGWLLVVALTGFFLGFGSILTGVWAMEQLKADADKPRTTVVDVRDPPVNVDVVYKTALSAAPDGWAVEFVIWPESLFTTNHNYAVRIKGTGLNEKLFRVILVDAVSAKVIRTVELPWYMKTLALSQPLHFGNYGGLPLKILWTVFTWLTMYIVGNGSWLWWKRRGKKIPTKQKLVIAKQGSI